MKLTKDMLTKMVKEVIQEQANEMFIVGGNNKTKSKAKKYNAIMDVKLYVEWDEFRNAYSYCYLAGEPRLVSHGAVENAMEKSDSSQSSPSKELTMDAIGAEFDMLLKLYKNQSKG